MIQAELVGLSDIDRIWPQVAEYISRALTKAPMEIGAGDIWTNCRSGQWPLIVVHDGERLLGASVWRFSANRFFECVVLGGERFHDWLETLIEFAKRIGETAGCSGLIATGRIGLHKRIKAKSPRLKLVRATYLLEF